MQRDWSPRNYLLLGLFSIFVILGGFAVWSQVTEISGAVTAPGRVEVEARRQVLQHPDGGIVEKIDVRDGQSVTAGEELIRLDGTELRAQQSLLRRQLWETVARIDRLSSEVAGLTQVRFSQELMDAAKDAPEIAHLVDEERALFQSRLDTMAKTADQLNERKVQTGALIKGYERQIDAQKRQLDLIKQELADQMSLYDKGLTQFAKVSSLRRGEAELEGSVGKLEASIAEAKSAIAGYEIQLLRTEATRREDTQDEMRKLQPQEAELREKLRLVETKLSRLVLRAPMSGRILALQIHTIGGVVTPGRDIVSIVPKDTPLIFTVRIDPRQIDRVRPGLPVEIRFPNFNSRITPSFDGKVRFISADTVTDQQTGTTYYTAELELSKSSEEKLKSFDLQPGMPLEAFIETSARTPASFLLKPVADYLSYAMREK